MKAGLQALARVGQVYPSSTDANSLGYAGDWGPYGDRSGDCKKLAGIAYYRAGLTLVRGNAKPTFDHYYANRTNRGTGLRPPYGALVGFNVALPYGHIAVAVGGNRVASTVGSESARRANAVQTTSSYSNYAGWVVP